jgi:hypothetical protein
MDARSLVRSLVGVFSFVTASETVRAQNPAGPTAPSQTLSVFLDCDDCDSEYVRTEINYVNWVRDRTVADVHLLVTEQDGAGNSETYTLAFIGQRAFAGRSDTLFYATNPTTTQDEERTGLTRTLALGLVPFVSRTSAAQSLRISMPRVADDAPGTQTMPTHDPWKAWVFEIDLSGDLNGERSERSREVDAEFSANRTTAEWKLEVESSLNFSNERITDEEFDSLGNVISSETFTNNQRSWRNDLLLVKSLSNHLSVGVVAALSSETFRNQKLRAEVTPAVEYNLFDYRESTRRYLALQFGVGVDAFVYEDTTIFDKLRETFPVGIAAIEYATRQPWGDSNVRFEHRRYVNEPSKRSTDLSGNLSVRLFRGFSVRFGGEYSWIHDQVYLPKGERDQADVLLRRRALLTGYEYNAYFGVTYTFGSIFNNVVNPRFF